MLHKKKVCLLGAFAVGKTSLVRRYVEAIYSDKYLTTVGVEIKKRTVQVGEHEVYLVIWDLAGEDEFQKVQLSYLRGASGYLLVADGTRRTTLDTAKVLQQRVNDSVGPVPFILLVNKTDLHSEWEIDEAALAEFSAAGWHIVKTSAKSGDNVEAAFQTLAELTLTK
ncbi:MAG: GTP-binding protein [Acidobacteria bacterium]|nr:GTP-binding protein [Acidobacteriota bacterium]MBI3427367.1 GTP-binding protein [Acidobacteriota bacterium]